MSIFFLMHSLRPANQHVVLRFPRPYSYEYSLRLFNGTLLAPKYRSLGRAIHARKTQEGIEAEYRSREYTGQDDGA